MCAAHHEKSFVPAFFKVSIDHLFDNLESEKEIIVLEKKPRILDPKICTNPTLCLIASFRKRTLGTELRVVFTSQGVGVICGVISGVIVHKSEE